MGIYDAWAAELDRSFTEIGEIAADARTFDRLRLNRIADSWDNSIYSFVRAACARRPWVRTAIARDGTAYRDWRSDPAELEPLTPDLAAELDAHFDLPQAEVSELTIERSRGRLECRMSIVAERTEISYILPDIRVVCSGVETMRFDGMDRHGFEVLGEHGVSVGAAGHVVASEITFSVGHHSWRAVGNHSPEPVARVRRSGPRIRGTALEAAELLRAALLLTRGVWALQLTHVIPVRSFGRVFSNAGTDILAAGSAVRREDAFRRLVERWRTAGGAELARWFDDPMALAFPKPEGEPAPAAELMIAGFAVHPAPSTATLVYASPGEPWTLRRVAVEDPSQFTVDRGAFDCPRADAERAGLVRLER